MKPCVSLVIPIYNEEDNLPELRRRLDGVLSAEDALAFEIVLVDDHSLDCTRELCLEWVNQDPRVRYLRMSRNFGSHAACTAGLEEAQGDAALVMAADLQDPPEDVPKLLRSWEGGAQVVWAVRSAREGEPLSRILPARVYYWLMRHVAKLDLPPEGADFVLVDRCVIDAVLRCRETSASLFALVSWAGFRQTSVPYVKRARHAGQSGWTVRKKVRLLVNSIVGFTLWPVRLLLVIGVLAASAAIGYAVLLIVLRLSGRITVSGFTAVMVTMLFGFGLVMVMIGMLGEYLWRALEHARARPRYLLEERANPSASHRLEQTRA